MSLPHSLFSHQLHSFQEFLFLPVIVDDKHDDTNN